MDTAVQSGVLYEYRVEYHWWQDESSTTLVGKDVPPSHSRGATLIVVDSSIASGISSELAQYRQDLVGDGWEVIQISSARGVNTPGPGDDPTAYAAQVKDLRAQIQAVFASKPSLQAVLLVGHLPVARTGQNWPDGHGPNSGSHQGAWPFDGFYGEMISGYSAGGWTDSGTMANNDLPQDNNSPNDGKFDQDAPPTPVTLQVGRIDFANMPHFTSGEINLLKGYFAKDHQFRQAITRFPSTALVGGPRSSSFLMRNVLPEAQIQLLANYGNWMPTLANNSFLFSEAGGYGGFWNVDYVVASWNLNPLHWDEATMQWVGWTTPQNNYHDVAVRTAFSFFSGSYSAEWDYADNLLRASLCSGDNLTALWFYSEGHLNLRHMPFGETIGYSTRVSQTGKAVNLMGDPTLHMHILAPPTQLAVSTPGGNVQLQWQASVDTTDPNFLGYYVYSSDSVNGPFMLANGGNLVTGTSFTSAELEHRAVMVRAAKREYPFGSSGGSYINLSQGAFGEVLVLQNVYTESWSTLAFDVEGPPNESIVIQTSSDLVTWYGWDTGQLDAQGHYSQYDTGPLDSAVFFRVAAGSDNQYHSANAVGYTRRSIPAEATVAIANQFLRSDNSVQALLPDVPNFSTLYKWAGNNWDVNTFFFGSWSDPTMTLVPGEGALLSTDDAYTATFFGSVPEGTLQLQLPSGYAFVASKVPQAADVATLGLTVNNFDNVKIWNGSGYTVYTYAFGAWNPSTPVVVAGEPFFTNLGAPVTWTRTFSVWE